MVTKARQARGDGSLFQRSDGRWVARVVDADGKRRQKVRVKYEDAVAERNRMRDDARAGRRAQRGDLSVEKWLDKWLNEIHAGNIRPNVKDDYARTIRLHINPHIGRVRLDRLTSDDVRQMTRAVGRKSGRNAQIAYHIVNRALKDACADEVLHKNVAAVVPTPKHTKKRREAFSADVAKHIIRTAIELDGCDGKCATGECATCNAPLLATRWAAAFFTGARQGELLGLTWDRVDLDAATIDLEWQLQRLQKQHGCENHTENGTVSPSCGKQRAAYCPDAHWEFEPGFEYVVAHGCLAWTRPKSESGKRLVPLAPPLVEMLRVHQRVDSPNPHRLVWRHRDGRPVDGRDDYGFWQQVCIVAGVRGEKNDPVPLHRARNTTATLMLYAGIDAHIIVGAIGHNDVVTTRGYQHVDLKRQHEAFASMAELLK